MTRAHGVGPDALATIASACLARAAERQPEGPLAWSKLIAALGREAPGQPEAALHDALMAAMAHAQPQVALRVSQASVRLRQVPGQWHLRTGDAARAERLESAWRRHEAGLSSLQWGDATAAATACAIIALLRLDVVPGQLRAWLSEPLAALAPITQHECVRAQNSPLDPATFFALRAMRRHHPQVQALAACTQPSDVFAALAPCYEHAKPAAALEGDGAAWRRLRLPGALLTLNAEQLDGNPFCAYARAGFELGHEVARGMTWREEASVAAASMNAPSSDVVEPLESARQLRALASALRGKAVARAGERAQLTPAQAASLVAQTRASAPLGAMERCLLEWLEGKLRSGKRFVTSAAVRYLSALIHLVRAQGRTPVIELDPLGEGYRADAEHWQDIQELLVRTCPDRGAFKPLAQFARHLESRFPALGHVSVASEDLQALGVPQGPWLAPEAFELVAMQQWQVGSPDEKSAVLAAVLAYYLGWRSAEVRGFKLADVLDPECLLLQLRPHLSRTLKTRSASRTLVAAHWLPPHWCGWIREQWRDRMQVHAIDGYLLGQSQDIREPLSVATIQDVVLKLRTKAGDPGLTFHGLRHCAANVGLVRLFVALHPQMAAMPVAALADPAFGPGACAQWVRGWLPRGDTRAVALHEFARALGHGSWTTTFRHYVHVLPWISRALTTLALPPVRRAGVRALLQLDETVFHALEVRAGRHQRERFDEDVPTILAWAVMDELQRPLRVVAAPQKAPAQVAPAPALRALTAADVPRVLVALARGRETGTIARALGVSHDAVSALAPTLQALPDAVRERLAWACQRADFRQACGVIEGLVGTPGFDGVLAAWRAGGTQLRDRPWPRCSALSPLARLLAELNQVLSPPPSLQVSIVPWRRVVPTPGSAELVACTRAALVEAECPGRVVLTARREAPPGAALHPGEPFGHSITLRLVAGSSPAIPKAIDAGLWCAACLHLRMPLGAG